MEKRGIVDAANTPPERPVSPGQPTPQPKQLAQHLTKRAAQAARHAAPPKAEKDI